MATEPATDILGQTASTLAERVRAGDLSPVDVLQNHLAQIGALDARIGAFQLVRAHAALAEAEALAGNGDIEKLPLAGVPVAIKDNVDVEGEPTRDGSMATSTNKATADAELVARIRAAGGIVIGKTRVPELCAAATTDSVFGVSRNPWNLDRTPGGSSGGSAAAVASAMVPIAHGSDGGGSVRIPSAACGLVGMKPGIGVIPGAPDRSGWYGLSSNGPIATTVDDLALLLSVMADRPDLQTAETPTRSLRIAISTKPMMGRVVVDPAWAAAAEQTAEALRNAGHTVTHADPPYDSSMIRTMGVRGLAGIAEDAEGFARGQIERRNRTPVLIGKTIRRFGLLGDAGREQWRRQTAEFFQDVDVLVTPTLAQPVPRAEGWSRKSWIANVRGSDFAMFTGAWNLAGVPAMAIPAGLDGTGMPLSAQLVAAEGGEALLLSVAKQLEALRPWQRHAPLAV